MKFKGVHIFIAFVVLSVTASIVAGFMTIGSPKAERARQLDMQRINELQSITYAIDNYYNTLGKLPASLTDLASQRNVYVQSIVDPATQAPYEYRTSDADSYELCATFDGESVMEPEYQGAQLQKFWMHTAGYKCYALDVQKIQKM